jgi:hypothetical protein
MAQYVVDDARLQQIQLIHNKSDELRLDRPRHNVPGQLSHDSCELIHSLCSSLTIHTLPDEFCVLLPPRRSNPPESLLTNKVFAALATRFDTTVPIIRPLVADMKIDSFGKVRFIDGDTMVASSFLTVHDDVRDTSFIRVRRVVLTCKGYYSPIFNSMKFSLISTPASGNANPSTRRKYTMDNYSKFSLSNCPPLAH